MSDVTVCACTSWVLESISSTWRPIVGHRPFWIAQVLLAIGFIAAGLNHSVNYARASQRMGWMAAVGPGGMRAIGTLEVLGGIGVVLPAVTGVLPWLTPLAALCLAVLMAFAIVFHLRRGEMAAVIVNLVLGLLAAFVAYGRFVVEPF